MADLVQTEEKTIGKFRYTVARLPSRQVIHLSARIAKSFAPMLAAFAGGVDLEALIASSLSELFKNPELGSELVAISEELGQATTVSWSENGQPRDRVLQSDFFDLHFRNRLDEWLEWLAFAIRVNCASFFTGASGLGALLRSRAKVRSADAESRISGSQSGAERTG